MEWRDEGMVLGLRPHGENAAIIEVMTAAHGRHAGLVRGGMSRKQRPNLQPGTQVNLVWTARLEAHLGAYQVEPIRSRAGAVMGDRRALVGLNAVAAVVMAACPEREPLEWVYDATLALIDALGTQDWPARYALWERDLLSWLGFGLDLGACAVTGATDGLVYVSPKSGTAVSAAGAGEWASRLLPLPDFMRDASVAEGRAVLDGLRLTGYFLANRVLAQSRDGLPEARGRLVDFLEREMRDG